MVTLAGVVWPTLTGLGLGHLGSRPSDGLRMGESSWPPSTARVGDLPCEYDEAGRSVSDEIQEGPVGFDGQLRLGWA